LNIKLSKKRDDSYFAAQRRKKRKTMTVVIPVIIAVVAIGVAVSVLYKPGTALAIDGVECHSDEAIEFHQHAHLSVFVNGQEQQVPDNIGIVSTPYSCLFWLHTHQNDPGFIHIEAPRPMTFTLGQFMDIWNQTKSDSKSFFSTISALPVKAYVADKSNEQPKEFGGDPRNIQLKSQEQIVLAYGSPPTTIPSLDFKGRT
jgi:hypothetical protein